jgi:hypothetical protein
MKKRAYTMIAMLVALGLSTVVANAQTNGSTLLIADIPFGFNVGNDRLPAGEYVIRKVNPASDVVVLQIRKTDGSARAMIPMNSVIGTSRESAKLVFSCFGNQYFFAQTWFAGEAWGLQAPKSQLERATERELAAILQETEVAALTERH